MKERCGERVQNIDIDGAGDLIDLSTSGVALLLRASKQKDRNVVIFINDYKIESKVVYSIPKEERFRVGFHFQKVSKEMLANLVELVDNFSKGIPLKCQVEDAL